MQHWTIRVFETEPNHRLMVVATEDREDELSVGGEIELSYSPGMKCRIIKLLDFDPKLMESRHADAVYVSGPIDRMPTVTRF